MELAILAIEIGRSSAFPCPSVFRIFHVVERRIRDVVATTPATGDVIRWIGSQIIHETAKIVTLREVFEIERQGGGDVVSIVVPAFDVVVAYFHFARTATTTTTTTEAGGGLQ
jgi:hypothetical protein